jgi:sec-independent protein translocase protein TatB
MLDLSPAKLLVIVIVAVILLGPDKLPQVARQAGAAWRKLRDFQRRVDQEVRQNIPDLPSSHEIARFARSPMTVLNRWAALAPDDELVEDPGARTGAERGDGTAWPEDPTGEAGPEAATGSTGTAGSTGSTGSASAASAASAEHAVDDPSMN